MPLFPLLAVPFPMLTGCEAAATDGYLLDADSSSETGGDGASPSLDTGGAGEGDFADDEDTSPPETEDTPLLYKPAVTERWLFVVNPDRDSLTRVEVDTLTSGHWRALGEDEAGELGRALGLS